MTTNLHAKCPLFSPAIENGYWLRLNSQGTEIEGAGVNALEGNLNWQIPVAKDVASLNACITALSGTNGTIYIYPGDYTINEDVTFPSNVNVIFPKGAKFNISTGVTVTFSGSIEAGLYQAFNCSGTGTVIFGTGTVTEAYPEWWGDSATDFYGPLNAAVNSGAKKITLGEKTYSRTTDTVISVPTGVHIWGKGQQTVLSVASGTSDIFSADGVSGVGFHNFKMTGPDNTSVDGLYINNTTDFIVENVEGYQLSSTITVGALVASSRGEIRNVYSNDNAQHGIHLNKADDVKTIGGTSSNIGTTNLHHGIYLGSVTNVLVTGHTSFSNAGSGIQLYPAASFDCYNVRIIENDLYSNGTSASGIRGNLILSGASGSTVVNVITSDNITKAGNGYNIFVGNVQDVEVSDNVIDGASVTVNGLYAESVVDNEKSLKFRNNRIKNHTSSGIRLVFTTGTVTECDIGGNLIKDNDTGIYATGDAMQNIIFSSYNWLEGNTTNLNGNFSGLYSFRKVVSLATAAKTFTVFTVPANHSFLPTMLAARCDTDVTATNGEYWSFGVNDTNRRNDFGVCSTVSASNKHSKNAKLRWLNSVEKTNQIIDSTEVFSLLSVADTTDTSALGSNIGGTDQSITVDVWGNLISDKMSL